MRFNSLFVVVLALTAMLALAQAQDVCLDVYAQGYSSQWNAANTGCPSAGMCTWRTLLRIDTFTGELQFINALVGPNQASLRAVTGFNPSGYELECYPSDNIFMSVAGLEWQLHQSCEATMQNFAAATSDSLRSAPFDYGTRVARAIGLVRAGHDGPFFANSTIEDSLVPCSSLFYA